ncbi:hypothetical protein QJS10_CPA10g01835 [Acorus calamus]|uniref:Reverse transcriptase zinc-binding domain-containing protein n=1 Tax=Acorus calamus TaxID=4465 RepID=A0AAV9E1D6_ACOCL|nr:hypothetical protein QJS10_CPA10g01835 [Acorus calamus]
MEEGGLGLKRIKQWNEAAIGTRLWEIVARDDSLWTNWIRTKYLKQQSIWAVSSSTSASWAWAHILASHCWIKQRSNVLVFSGDFTNLWHDPWIDGQALKEKLPPHMAFHWGPTKSTLVSKLINNGEWSTSIRWPPTYLEVWEDISRVRVGGTHADIPIWMGSKSGTLNAKAAWNFLRTPKPQVPWKGWAWDPGQIPRHSYTTWLALLHKLLTLQKLQN